MPLGAHMDIEPALFGRPVDRPVDIQFILGAFTGEFAQSPERDLDIACSQQLGVVEILKLALVPDLDSFFLAAFTANPDALGIIARIAVR